MADQTIELYRTCYACPEQYDAKLNGETVGYLRLRHGSFRVDCPDCGGDRVYQAEPKGDGIFEPEERDYYLRFAVAAILQWLANNRQPPKPVPAPEVAYRVIGGDA